MERECIHFFLFILQKFHNLCSSAISFPNKSEVRSGTHFSIEFHQIPINLLLIFATNFWSTMLVITIVIQKHYIINVRYILCHAISAGLPSVFFLFFLPFFFFLGFCDSTLGAASSFGGSSLTSGSGSGAAGSSAAGSSAAGSSGAGSAGACTWLKGEFTLVMIQSSLLYLLLFFYWIFLNLFGLFFLLCHGEWCASRSDFESFPLTSLLSCAWQSFLPADSYYYFLSHHFIFAHLNHNLLWQSLMFQPP